MLNNVCHIGEKSNNAAHYTVEQMLEQALDEFQCNKIKGKKAIIVFLDDDNDRYDVKFRNAGLSCSQIIALAEVLKASALKHMGY